MQLHRLTNEETVNYTYTDIQLKIEPAYHYPFSLRFHNLIVGSHLVLKKRHEHKHNNISFIYILHNHNIYQHHHRIKKTII